MIGAACLLRYPVHRLLHLSGEGVIERIDRFTALEIDVRVLSSPTDKWMVRRETARPQSQHQFVVDHGANRASGQRHDFHDLMRGAEAIAEMEEWHPGFQSRRVSDHRQVLCFLDGT